MNEYNFRLLVIINANNCILLPAFSPAVYRKSFVTLPKIQGHIHSNIADIGVLSDKQLLTLR